MENGKKTESIKPNFSKLRIIKNLLMISSSFLLLFLGFDGLSMLQATMNKTKGVGVLSQAVIYLIFGICSLLLPKFVIKKLGAKITICLGMTTYIPYLASNYYPEFSLMLPSAVLVGIGASMLWGAQGTYFNRCCFMYWKLINQSQIKRNQSSCLKKLDESCLSKTEEISIRESKVISNSNEKNDYLVKDDLLNSKQRGSDIFVAFKNSKDNEEELQYQNKEKSDVLKVDSRRASYGSITDADSSDQEKNGSIPKFASIESINAVFFGLHGLIYWLSMFWSNLLSYFVLKPDHILNIVNASDCSCGANFCNDIACFASETLAEIPQEFRITFTSICVVLSIIGALVIGFFVDSLEDRDTDNTFSLGLLLAFLKHVKKKEQLFLIPFSFLLGMVQGFYMGDYTRSFIACSLGIYRVGLVTMVYGLAVAFTSPLAGVAVKHFGRLPVILAGFAINICTYISLLVWKPSYDQLYVFFLLAAAYGIFIGIYWSQLIAFYGILFKDDEEVAFGFHFLCGSFGTCASFVSNDYLCSYEKIYILFLIIFLAAIGYLVTERIFYLRKNNSCSAG